ncbi:hypothetical protein ACFXC8_53305 [Streptomyces sp. NPDC059441]|uniref:hypothetical protein n=1 Tax=Streptomyces TaxID=1883 RepID=UPI0035DF4EF1
MKRISWRSSDSSALDEMAAAVPGDTAAIASALSHTAQPYAAAAGGALVLLEGCSRPTLTLISPALDIPFLVLRNSPFRGLDTAASMSTGTEEPATP